MLGLAIRVRTTTSRLPVSPVPLSAMKDGSLCSSSSRAHLAVQALQVANISGYLKHQSHYIISAGIQMMQSGGFEESAEPIPFRCRPRHSTATLSSAWNLCQSLRFERMDVMREPVGNWPGGHSWGRKPGRQCRRTPLSRVAPAALPRPKSRRG